MKRRNSFSLSIAALALCAFGANLFAQEDRRPENESLLETIKIEAANMEVFPVDLIAKNSLGAINRKQEKASGKEVGVWVDRTELTFERYLPFYRFKTRVGLATPEEIEECVENFKGFSVKEKALVIAAIFIFERIHRRSSQNDEDLDPYVSSLERLLNTPPNGFFFNKVTLLLPKFESIDSITDNQWNQWISVIEDCLLDQEEAFPALEPEKGKLQNVFLPIETSDSNDELFLSWKRNLEECKRKVNTRLNITLDQFAREREFMIERTFLSKIYELSLDPARSQFEDEFALWDYYFALQEDPMDNIRYHAESPVSGNSSFVPKTLGDIADQLLKSRLEYDSADPSPEPQPQQ